MLMSFLNYFLVYELYLNKVVEKKSDTHTSFTFPQFCSVMSFRAFLLPVQNSVRDHALHLIIMSLYPVMFLKGCSKKCING